MAGPSGDPSGADAIRHIDYAFRVDRTFHGRGRVGRVVTVTVVSGSVATRREVPRLQVGEPHIVFATAGSDGRYDPLAGGAAMAAKQADGSYALPNSVSDAGVLTFPAARLAAVPRPD